MAKSPQTKSATRDADTLLSSLRSPAMIEAVQAMTDALQMGVIDARQLYTKEALIERLGITNSQYRAMHAANIPQVNFFKKSFFIGADVIDWFRNLPVREQVGRPPIAAKPRRRVTKKAK